MHVCLGTVSKTPVENSATAHGCFVTGKRNISLGVAYRHAISINGATAGTNNFSIFSSFDLSGRRIAAKGDTAITIQ